MTREEIKGMMQEMREENNPINMLKSGWFILVAAAAAIASFTNLQAQSNQNTQDILDLQTVLSQDLADIEGALDKQSSRFELYLESLREVRIENENDIEQLEQRINELERRILRTENSGSTNPR